MNRYNATGAGDGLARAALEEVDYPMVMVTGDLVPQLTNRWARTVLRAPARVVLRPGGLQFDDAADGQALRAAVTDATRRDLRRTLLLPGLGAVSVVPLPAEGGSRAVALLIFAKPAVCQTLSIDGFARECALTPGETQVLHRLCEGESPQRIARQRGVALSTVRTQIGSMRAKTDSKDIRALMHQLAKLPPLVPRAGLTRATA